MQDLKVLSIEIDNVLANETTESLCNYLKNKKMAKRNTLKQAYHKETGNYWKENEVDTIPTIEYTNWLEDRLVKNNDSLDIIDLGEDETGDCPHFDKCINVGKNKECSLRLLNNLDCYKEKCTYCDGSVNNNVCIKCGKINF